MRMGSLLSHHYTVLLVGLRRYRLWGLMGSDGMTCRRRRSRDSSNASAAGNESLTSTLSWMLFWRECDWEQSMTAVVGRLRLPGTDVGTLPSREKLKRLKRSRCDRILSPHPVSVCSRPFSRLESPAGLATTKILSLSGCIREMCIVDVKLALRVVGCTRNMKWGTHARLRGTTED